MIALTLIALLSCVYSLSQHFIKKQSLNSTSLEEAITNLNFNDFLSSVKTKVNAHYGAPVISEIHLHFVGYGFEGLDIDGEKPPGYLIAAQVKVDTTETCLHVLVNTPSQEDITPTVNTLIKRIGSLKKDLRIQC